MLVPVARAQVTQYLVFISQEVVDTVDDRIKAWLSLEIDVGLETDTDTVVGVLLLEVINGINTPLKNTKILLEISFPHAGLTDKIRDVLDLFVYRVAVDDFFYPNFVRRLVSIAWDFLVKLYNLLAVPQLDYTYRFSGIADKLDGFVELFHLEGLSEKFSICRVSMKSSTRRSCSQQLRRILVTLLR